MQSGENQIEGRKSRNVQKEKGKTVERFKKCRKRRAMDWAKGIGTSNKWEIENNKETVEDCERRSRKEWKCGDKIVVRMDEFRKIDGEMGTIV